MNILYGILILLYNIIPVKCTNESDWDNATWVISCAFIIITMQSGFGLLESGMVSSKNQTHIMIKNICDIIFGGFAYWIFGYGLSFGDSEYSNSFNSLGNFFTEQDDDYGWLYSKYFFQFTFATTATTIVSGCLAERTKFEAYVLFSILNIFIYAIPAHWVWHDKGWLYKMGVIVYSLLERISNIT